MPTRPEYDNSENERIDFTEKLKEVVRANGINDTVSEVIIKDAGLKGENFASLTQYVTVKFENPQLKPLNLFVKVPTPNASHIAMLDELKAFQKEARFLVDYVAAANKICKLKGLEGFIDFYPKIYYGDDNLIVLENLVLDKGYEMVDKEVLQDLETAKIAIKTLAKHHAISYVMIQESGGKKKFFEKFPNLDYESFDKPLIMGIMKPTFDNTINANVKILEISGSEGASAASAKLKSFLGKPMTILLNCLHEVDEETLLVLGHGDYWNNNMMFLKDKGTNKILHHVAIDFQLTRYNSLAIDLGYYFFTSVQQNVRQNHLQELLELYRETLNKTTDDFGHPFNLSSERLFLEFRKKVGFGYWVGMNFTVGPGMSIYKDVDITQIDVKDWNTITDQLAHKWIDDNPHKSIDVANQIVRLIKEYEDLALE